MTACIVTVAFHTDTLLAVDTAEGVYVAVNPILAEGSTVMGLPCFGCQAAAQLCFKLGLPVVPTMQRDPRQGAMLEVAA